MKLKVHDPSGQAIADVYEYEAGALLMWLEGADGEGAQSYDNTAFIVDERLKKAIASERLKKAGVFQ